MIHFFHDLPPHAAADAGGKGRTLAHLFRAGFPVPPGFVILPGAFGDDGVRADVWPDVLAAWQRLGAAPVAVRSSARGEDAADVSFAGEFETVLGVDSAESLHAAVNTVFRSRNSERVQIYSARQGVTGVATMAVVVQTMVPAEFAGVLFTADPISADRVHMPGNFVSGLGEKLVGGQANAVPFKLVRPGGTITGSFEMRPYADALYRLALRLEATLGGPQDIEFAVAGGRVWLLQSRPITGLTVHDPATYAWNATRSGHFVWTNTNFAEAIPEVVTPLTWSLLADLLPRVLPLSAPGYPIVNNIGGRVYLNYSIYWAVLEALGPLARANRELTPFVFGTLPDGMTLPKVPLPPATLRRHVLPRVLAFAWGMLRHRGRAAAFARRARARLLAAEAAVLAATTPGQLRAVWDEAFAPFAAESAMMITISASGALSYSRLLAALTERVGSADAVALLSGFSDADDHLESLGPLVGLQQVLDGTLSRDDYQLRYGHRAPNEAEVAAPRPREAPHWLDRLLAEHAAGGQDVVAMLAQRRRERDAAWERLRAQYPFAAWWLLRQIDAQARAAHDRERVRTEAARANWVVRLLALRAGEMLGVGDAVFFLSIDELQALLDGDRSALGHVPARRATFGRYRALPPYPSIIKGRFEPQQWAADPQRRPDFHDASLPPAAPTGPSLTGYAGAAGVVEGVVRVLQSPDESALLQPGEILVTHLTNIGWTPLFPRAAAIITDIGAPLSHAAIVARELGIPAVVGTGQATARLATGDRVRVDGAAGVVEILSDGSDPP